MIPRGLLGRVEQLLDRHATVALLGPRQVGKTTLALTIAARRPSVYLDLEASAARAKLTEPELYLANHSDKLVILDEIQRTPDLFAALRGVIDRRRRDGNKTAQFLVLGSASPDLLRQSAETLAGRIAYTELGPLNASELPDPTQQDQLWLRGGFPESFLAPDDETSLEWRTAFIRTYLERDIPQLGSNVPAETLRRFWTMLAHEQGGMLNAARLAASLAVSGQSVARYLDLMVDLLLVRRLAPWSTNVGKRLVRSPKVYVRDSGLVHALLGLDSLESTLGHPVAGGSWEGFVLETLIGSAPQSAQPFFYRTAAGAEIDLVLAFPDQSSWAFDVKRSLAPQPEHGFHKACDTLQPTRRFVVYPGHERFPLTPDLEAISLVDAAAELRR